MRVFLYIFLIFRLALFPIQSAAGEDLKALPPAKAGLALEIIGLNLVFFSTVFILWQKFFKKDKYFFNTKTGECWILWQGRAVKLKECPTEVTKQFKN